MDASPAVLNEQALRRMQLAAYQRAKLRPPDLSPAALTARDAASLQALEPGGSIEQAIAHRLRSHGRDPEAAKGEVARLREAAQQIDQHATPLVDSGEGQRLCHPRHAKILSTQRKRLEGLVNFGLPEFTGAFSWLRDKVTLSTLLTGELNARTFKAPFAQDSQPQYWILFDPIFFDFFYHLSNAFASAIDMDGLDKFGNRYAKGDDTASVDNAIHWGGPEPVEMAYKMLRSFVALASHLWISCPTTTASSPSRRHCAIRLRFLSLRMNTLTSFAEIWTTARTISYLGRPRSMPTSSAFAYPMQY